MSPAQRRYLIIDQGLGAAEVSALGVDQVSFRRFVMLKASYAAALAAVVTPVIGLCVLGDADPQEEVNQ